MQENLTCSLVALAILALRNGDYVDAARLLGQASVSPDSEKFLEDILAHNLEARALVSASSAGGLNEAVKAMSSAFQVLGEEDDEDEMHSMSYGDELEETAVHELMDATVQDSDHDLSDDEDAQDDEDESEEDIDEDQTLESGIREEDVEVVTLSSSSGIKLKISAPSQTFKSSTGLKLNITE